jgi:hypothetical protein
MDQNKDLLDYKLPLREVVKERLVRANSTFRGVVEKKIKGYNWAWNDLPPVLLSRSKTKIPCLVTRPNVAVRETGKNHYLTVELPNPPEKGPSTSDFIKQAHFANRRDAFDILQAQSYIEQSLGAAVQVLMNTKAIFKDRSNATESLLSGVLSLKTQMGLTVCILANSTSACRSIELEGTNFNKEFADSLMTMPVESHQVLPHLLEAQRAQAKESSSLVSLSQRMEGYMANQQKQNARFVGRGRGRGGRGRGAQTYDKTNQNTQADQKKFFGGARGRGGRGGRGRGRGAHKSVSNNQPSKSKKMR